MARTQGSNGADITSGESGLSRRLDVSSRSDSRLFYASRDLSAAYVWTGVYNSGNGETILLVKNTSTLNLFITEVAFVNDAATRVRVHIPSTVANPTGTTITGVSLDTGSSEPAIAVARQNESTNSLGDIIKDTLIGANEEHNETWEDGLIIVPSQSVAVDFATGSSALCGATIIGYFQNRTD